MKHTLQLISLFIIGFTFFLSSCTKSEKINPAQTPTDQASNAGEILAQAAAAKAQYQITLFMDDNRNKTSQYTNYVFVIQQDGIIIATDTNTGIKYYGYYFFDDEHEEVDIDFDTETRLDELRGDWDIVLVSNKTISLEDGDDKLVLKRIN